jgi:signal peptidase I
MSKGYLVMAQSGYARNAEALAESIKISQSEVSNISIITDQTVSKELFDHIIPLPQEDLSGNNQWKIHNRVYFKDLTPYDETVILDADMLFLSDVSHWWKLFQHYDVLITNRVLTYRGEIIENSPYRKTFVENNLPDLYSAFTYFKKDSETTDQFFKLLKSIIQNWDQWTERYTPEYKQKFESIDLAMAMAVKILGIEDQIVSNIDYPCFTHMKAGCQGWNQNSLYDRWDELIGFYKNDNIVNIGAFQQTGILHYVIKDLV